MCSRGHAFCLYQLAGKCMKFRENYFKALFISCYAIKKKVVGMHEFWFFVAKDQSTLGILLIFAVFTASIYVYL